MVADVLVPISFFLVVFGMVYLFLSTRNKERLALIEKGVDASVFMRGPKANSGSFYKVVLLNIALLLMGIGLGIFLGLILSTYTSLNSEAIYPAVIFFTAGAALFIGFSMTRKWKNGEE